MLSTQASFWSPNYTSYHAQWTVSTWFGLYDWATLRGLERVGIRVPEFVGNCNLWHKQNTAIWLEPHNFMRQTQNLVLACNHVIVPPLLILSTKSMNAKRGEDMNSVLEKLRMAASPLLFSTPWEVWAQLHRLSTSDSLIWLLISYTNHTAQSFSWYGVDYAFLYFALPLLVWEGQDVQRQISLAYSQQTQP